jgi:hypothetical protein
MAEPKDQQQQNNSSNWFEAIHVPPHILFLAADDLYGCAPHHIGMFPNKYHLSENAMIGKWALFKCGPERCWVALRNTESDFS